MDMSQNEQQHDQQQDQQEHHQDQLLQQPVSDDQQDELITTLHDIPPPPTKLSKHSTVSSVVLPTTTALETVSPLANTTDTAQTDDTLPSTIPTTAGAVAAAAAAAAAAATVAAAAAAASVENDNALGITSEPITSASVVPVVDVSHNAVVSDATNLPVVLATSPSSISHINSVVVADEADIADIAPTTVPALTSAPSEVADISSSAAPSVVPVTNASIATSVAPTAHSTAAPASGSSNTPSGVIAVAPSTSPVDATLDVDVQSALGNTPNTSVEPAVKNVLEPHMSSSQAAALSTDVNSGNGLVMNVGISRNENLVAHSDKDISVDDKQSGVGNTKTETQITEATKPDGDIDMNGDDDREGDENGSAGVVPMSPGDSSPTSATPPANATSAEKPGRRTRTRLTVAQKVDVLRRLDKGERQSALAAEYGCSKRALARLKQERATFHNLHLTEADANRKSRHSVKHVILESKLSQFLRLARRNGFPINGNAVRRAALKLRDDLLVDPNLPAAERPGLVAFQASINWSKGFLKRCGIRTVDGKHDDLSPQQMQDIKKQLGRQLAEYDVDCILCVEKTLMFYKLLPNEPILQLSSVRTDEQISEDGVEDRVTLIVAANITGSVKVSPTIVGSAATPPCFREQQCKLPYLSHAYSWVDDATFKTWFYCVLLPSIRRCTSKRVAVLVNAEWAPIDFTDSQGQVQLISMPKELPFDRHPMNTGILSVFRRSLRYSLLTQLVNIDGTGGDATAPSKLEDSLTNTATTAHVAPAVSSTEAVSEGNTTRGAVSERDLTLVDLAQFVEEAWDGLTEKLMAQCWYKADILPEKHAQQLGGASSAAAGTSEEQMFFACCTPSQIRAIRILEDLIINRQLYAADSSSRRAKELVTSLHETGRRGIEAWLDIESSTRAQRALSGELERIIASYKSPIVPQKTPAKRTAGQAFGSTENAASEGHDKQAEPLPHLAYLMDLLAPIQKIVEECDSGSASQLLRNLKQELVRVKSEQDRRIVATS